MTLGDVVESKVDDWVAITDKKNYESTGTSKVSRRNGEFEKPTNLLLKI